MKKTILTVVAFLAVAAGIAYYALREVEEPEPPAERHRMRVVVPSVAGEPGQAGAAPGALARESAYVLKAPMQQGELVISVLNHDFDNSGVEDQVVAFRPNGAGGAVYIAFFSSPDHYSYYRRMWEVPTTATVPETVSLFTLDLLGDRGNAIIVTGMNELNEQTLTAFRKSPFDDPYRPFDVIADIRIDGSVAVREVQRSLAFQQGVARGQPFDIVASGRDYGSDNMLDRIELTYSFNEAVGVYMRVGMARIPGARIEQDQVRHILSGAPGVFEGFMHDLWYHVTPAGTIDRSQFIFFDPDRREIVFFGEESQQIFVWQQSNATRQGLLVSSYNSAINSMRRRVNVELESMDSIRVTVTDERRQRIGIPPPWSGTYRRAGAVIRAMEETHAMAPHKDAVFDSPIGRLRFLPCGEYELAGHGAFSRGRHAFFTAGGMDFLELRPERGYALALGALVAPAHAPGGGDEDRHVFRVTGISRNSRGEPDSEPRYMSLSRVRLGATGAQDLRETQIALTRADL